MKTLDRYIAWNFFEMLVLWLVVILALRIVGDLFQNMDEFTEFAEKQNIAIPMGQVIWKIVDYYLHQSLVYFKEMGGIITILAATFTLARMNYSNELTAMLASGVSLHRVLWPILLAALLTNALLVVDQEVVIPRVRDQLNREPQSVPTEMRKEFLVKFPTDQYGSVWWAALFDPNDDPPRLDYALVILRDRENRYVADIRAKKANPGRYQSGKIDQTGWMAREATIRRHGTTANNSWRHEQNTRRIYTTISPEEIIQTGRARYRERTGQPIPQGKWITEVGNVIERDPHFSMILRAEKFLPGPVVRIEDSQSGLSKQMVLEGQLLKPRFEFIGPDDRLLAVIAADEATWQPTESPHTAHWALKAGRLFHGTDLSPKDLELRQDQSWMEFLSIGELSDLLAVKSGVDTETARQTMFYRLADPLNNIVLLLLGTPFILSRQRNLKASAALCVATCAVFYVFIYLCRYIGLSDFLAAFLPLLIFGPISVVMVDAIKT